MRHAAHETRGIDARNRDHRPGPPARAAAAARIATAGGGLPRRLSPRKQPRQGRSRATVEAILGAAVDLLAAHGYADTSTNQIAARAGVSVGSLYQYFPNKQAIVTALFQRHASSIDAIVEAAFAELRRPDVALREAFGRMLRDFEALHDAVPKMARAMDPVADGRHELAQVVRRGEGRFRQQLAEILGERHDVRRGDHTLMASLLFDVVEAIVRSLMHGDARRFDREAARREAVEAICRYLET